MRFRRIATGNAGRLGPVAVAGLVVAILALAASVDPAHGVTSSGSPFADEAFNAVNARNLVLLGRWSTDSWNLYLVDLPFSVSLAIAFKLIGVGIVQARLVSIAAIGLTVALLGLGLRRAFGAMPATLGALALGTSALVLFYGRLVYQEDLETLFLVATALALATTGRLAPSRAGTLTGCLAALAIATKPSAVFAVAGIFLAVAVVQWRSTPIRSTLAWAMAAIGMLGAAWAVAVWLPNRAAVGNVMKIWPQFTWPASPSALAGRIVRYAATNDHAALLSLPLLIGGIAGLAGLAVRRRTLEGQARTLVIASIGWLAGGFGILSVASYRPNRYVVPLLPALAILLAAGLWSAWPWLRDRWPPLARLAGPVVLAAAVAFPGLAAYASWTVGAPSSAPAIQATMAPLVPRGSVVVGVDSALFLMRAPVVTIITWKGVPGNQGDLYRSAGARWYLTNGDDAPYAVTLPPGAWAARRKVGCATWYGTLDCLYQVP